MQYSASFTGGIRVAARDINGDGRVDLLVNKETGDAGDLMVFDGGSLTILDDFHVRNPGLNRRGFWS